MAIIFNNMIFFSYSKISLENVAMSQYLNISEHLTCNCTSHFRVHFLHCEELILGFFNQGKLFKNANAMLNLDSSLMSNNKAFRFEDKKLHYIYHKT